MNIEPSKRPRRSEPYFDWKRNCLFCGEACIDKDPKHPDRWREYFECHTSEHTYKNGESMPTFKDILLLKSVRNDKMIGQTKSESDSVTRVAYMIYIQLMQDIIMIAERSSKTHKHGQGKK